MLKVISRMSLPVVILSLLGLALGRSLFSLSPLLLAIQAMAVGLAVWARRSFPRGAFRTAATPSGDGLIRRGPYRFIRHPMYSAALTLIWSGILTHLSMWSAGVGVVVTAFAIARIVVEERLLGEQYPEYGAYVGATKALIPFVV